MDSLCTKCYGKGLCGRAKCPILSKLHAGRKIDFKQEFSGQTNNVFVGRIGYPYINVGILSTDMYDHNDDPAYWVKNSVPIDSIIEKRVQLVNSRFKSTVKKINASNRFLDIAKEVSLAKKENDVEVELKDKPKFHVSFNNDLMPHGPKEELKRAILTSNPKIPHAVEKVVDDSDLKATESLKYLRNKGLDVYYMTKAFSLGNFGTKLERKLVPTRWSITAVDSTLSKEILKEVKQFKQNSEYFSVFGGLKGNYYLVLFLPGAFEYELFEMYVPGSVWNSDKKLVYETDYESFFGRKSYADNTVGGYYAARLPLSEYLKCKKMQSRVLVLRFTTSDYYAPLGVWYCRESIKKALENKGIFFSDEKLLLKYAQLLAEKKFNVNLSEILKKSKILNNNQKKLNQFVS